MSIKKVFLGGFAFVLFLSLLAFGVVFSAPQKTVAKADGEVEIVYHAIITPEMAYGAYYDNSSQIHFTNLILQEATQSEQAKLYNAYTSNEDSTQIDPSGINVTHNSNITQYLQGDVVTTFADEEVSLAGIQFNGGVILPELGWFYESNNINGQITLTSLYAIENNTNGNIPSNFISGHYAENVINLYCILNPYSVPLISGDLGKYWDGSNEAPDPIATIPYLSQNALPTPTPTNKNKYRFVGFYTEENGQGEQITDEGGNLLAPWTHTGITLYAYYLPINNITYHYTYGNNNFTGTISYLASQSSSLNFSNFNTDVANNQATKDGTTDQALFPTDKVIYGWFLNQDLTNELGTLSNGLNSLTFENNTLELWAKLAETHYTLTINANGGTFNDAINSTQISLTRPFRSTLLSAITDSTESLKALIASGAYATKNGYDWSNYYLIETADSTTKLNLNTQLLENKTVYIYWTPKKYKLTYKTDGSFTKAEQLLDYDTLLYDYLNPEGKTIPTNTGYNFVGWATADADEQTSFVITTRPTEADFETANHINLHMIQPTDTMPSQNIIVHSVWIQAYTIRLSLNQGTLNVTSTKIQNKQNEPLVLTLENGETLQKALDRLEVSDFFSNTTYQPALKGCNFVGWCYYKDGDVSNNSASNTYVLDSKVLSWDKDTLLAHNIDITTDATFAALYSYNKGDTFYTEAPADTTSTIFAIILMVISVALLIMLILNHKSNGIIEINDKAIEAYKHIYGEDAPLPTFESTKPPFEEDDELEQNKKKDE